MKKKFKFQLRRLNFKKKIISKIEYISALFVEYFLSKKYNISNTASHSVDNYLHNSYDSLSH